MFCRPTLLQARGRSKEDLHALCLESEKFGRACRRFHALPALTRGRVLSTAPPRGAESLAAAAMQAMDEVESAQLREVTVLTEPPARAAARHSDQQRWAAPPTSERSQEGPSSGAAEQQQAALSAPGGPPLARQQSSGISSGEAAPAPQQQPRDHMDKQQLQSPGGNAAHDAGAEPTSKLSPMTNAAPGGPAASPPVPSLPLPPRPTPAATEQSWPPTPAGPNSGTPPPTEQKVQMPRTVKKVVRVVKVVGTRATPGSVTPRVTASGDAAASDGALTPRLSAASGASLRTELAGRAPATRAPAPGGETPRVSATGDETGGATPRGRGDVSDAESGATTTPRKRVVVVVRRKRASPAAAAVGATVTGSREEVAGEDDGASAARPEIPATPI